MSDEEGPPAPERNDRIQARKEHERAEWLEIVKVRPAEGVGGCAAAGAFRGLSVLS